MSKTEDCFSKSSALDCEQSLSFPSVRWESVKSERRAPFPPPLPTSFAHFRLFVSRVGFHEQKPTARSLFSLCQEDTPYSRPSHLVVPSVYSIAPFHAPPKPPPFNSVCSGQSNTGQLRIFKLALFPLKKNPNKTNFNRSGKL